VEIKLVVNADDFGRTRDINRGILHAFRHGIVTSASLMVNFAAFDEAAQTAQEFDLPVGVHFNLTEGFPVSDSTDVASLVDSQGRFFRKNTFMLSLAQGRIKEREVRTELHAQMEMCRKAGLSPDHYDSHHHIHILPMIRRVSRDIAVEAGVVRARRISRPFPGQSMRSRSIQWLTFAAETKWSPTPDPTIFWGFDLMNQRDKRAVLRRTLNGLQPGVHELMCHPGFHSEDNIGFYNLERFDELQALCHESVTELAADNDIQLLSFNDLKNDYAN